MLCNLHHLFRSFLKPASTEQSFPNPLVAFVDPIAHNQLTCGDIISGFDAISKSLLQTHPDQNFQIVTSGPSCSVLYFGTRQHTESVTIFSHEAHVLSAVLTAARKPFLSPSYLGQPTSLFPGWLNADMTSRFTTAADCEELVHNSVKQNVKVYTSPSQNLIVFAADWKYQLVESIREAYDECMGDEDEMGLKRTSDRGKFASRMKLPDDDSIGNDVDAQSLDDALAILHEVNLSEGRRQIRQEMVGWYYYGYRMGLKETTFINKHYWGRYGDLGIADLSVE